MEIGDRTLIGLKLILEQFGIIVGIPMKVKSDPPNMDLVCAVIALMQLVHPMGYTFKLVRNEGIYRVRSENLAKQIVSLRKKSARGDFLLAGKRYAISKSSLHKANFVMHHAMPPKDVPFHPIDWLFLVGLYTALSQHVSNSVITDVIMQDYIRFLPYVDWAEEAVTMIRCEGTRL